MRTFRISLVRVLVVAVAAGAFSCSAPGRIAYEDAERTIVVRQPTDPADGARLEIDPSGAIRIATPETRTPASYTEKATVNWMMALGGLFAVAAVGFVVLKAKTTIVPSNAIVGCAIASAACFAFPTFLQKYLPHSLVALAVWGAWTVYSYRHNVKLKNAEPDPGEKRGPKDKANAANKLQSRA